MENKIYEIYWLIASWLVMSYFGLFDFGDATNIKVITYFIVLSVLALYTIHTIKN